MTGLSPYSIEKFDSFVRSFKKLGKTHNKATRKQVVDSLADVLEDLMDDPYPSTCRDEPLPSKMKLPEQWTFHKLTIQLGKGASGQIRLMYVVNETDRIIRPIWIYNHEQFATRPPDKDIQQAIQTALNP